MDIEHFGWCRDGVGMLQGSAVKGGRGTWLENSDYISPGTCPGSMIFLQQSSGLLLILGAGVGGRRLFGVNICLAHHFILLDFSVVLRIVI